MLLSGALILLSRTQASYSCYELYSDARTSFIYLFYPRYLCERKGLQRHFVSRMLSILVLKLSQCDKIPPKVEASLLCHIIIFIIIILIVRMKVLLSYLWGRSWSSGWCIPDRGWLSSWDGCHSRRCGYSCRWCSLCRYYYWWLRCSCWRNTGSHLTCTWTTCCRIYLWQYFLETKHTHNEISIKWLFMLSRNIQKVITIAKRNHNCSH